MSRDPLRVVRRLRSPVAVGRRVVLLLPERRRVDELTRLMHDREIARWTLRIPHPYGRRDALEFFRLARVARRAATGISLQIVRRRDDALLGGVGLHKLDPVHRSGEIGYWLGRPFRGEGYATEAVALLCRFGFRELGLRRIQAEVFVRNTPSARLLHRLGFRREGRLRQAVVKQGRGRDLWLYGRLAADPPPTFGRRSSAAPTK